MKKIAICLFLFALTSCSKNNMGEQNVNFGGLAGAVVGAITGGFAGAEFGGGLGQTLFISAGAMSGASIGYGAGTILHASDQAAYDTNARMALNTLENGLVSEWKNPDTGNSGIFIPTKTYLASNGRSCRSYRATLALKAQKEQSGIIRYQEGMACQQLDGSWRSISKNFG